MPFTSFFPSLPSSPLFLPPFSSIVKMALGSLFHWEFSFVNRNLTILVHNLALWVANFNWDWSICISSLLVWVFVPKVGDELDLLWFLLLQIILYFFINKNVNLFVLWSQNLGGLKLRIKYNI